MFTDLICTKFATCNNNSIHVFVKHHKGRDFRGAGGSRLCVLVKRSYEIRMYLVEICVFVCGGSKWRKFDR